MRGRTGDEGGSSGDRLIARLCLLVVVALAVGAATALGTSGGLRQLGCISNLGGDCADGRALDNPSAVAVDALGDSVYATSGSNGGSIAVFDRDDRGELTQKDREAGCVSLDDPEGCAIGRRINFPRSLVVSPDGANVYVAGSGGVAVFDRTHDGTDAVGTLTQKPLAAGCVVGIPTHGECGEADAMGNPMSIAVSGEGRGENVYVASDSGDIVAFFRDAAGVLSQIDCMEDAPATGSDCDLVRATTGRPSITVSPDGDNIYVASDEGVAVLTRDSSGKLSQPDGLEGCVSRFGGDCTLGRAMGTPSSVAVSADGGNAYVTSRGGEVAIFDRVDGVLDQKDGPDGCVQNFDGYLCGDSEAMATPVAIALTGSGSSAYVASTGSEGYSGTVADSAVAVFDRDAGTGTIAQRDPPHGCVADEPGALECDDGVGLNDPVSAVVSPDDANLYVAATASDAVAIFAIDTTAPETTITSGPEDGSAINESEAPFAFEADEPSTFECRVDDGDPFRCDSPVSLELEDGEHTFSVTAIDGTGNRDPTPATRTFTVDTVAPDTEILSGPEEGSQIADPTPTFEFSSAGPTESDATFTCSIDGAAPSGCDSPHTTEPLDDGDHTFSVAITDAAGNTDPTPASVTFTVDATGPETTITSGPAEGAHINDSTPTFGFESSEPPPDEGDGFRCEVDGGSPVGCDPPLTTAALADGPRTFAVSAVDDVGNVDPTPATRSFVVDTVAPNTTFTGGPADGSFTNDATPTFEFVADDEATFRCEVDDDPFDCTSPTTLDALDDGPHTIAVLATDEAGNVERAPAEIDFTVDTVAPETTITDGPRSPTDDPTATFEFEADEVAAFFTCQRDRLAPVRCTSPRTTSSLADGPHTFAVAATDRAGNTDPTADSRSFVVDTVAPDTTITDGPADGSRISDATPSFSFEPDEPSSMSCRIDGAAASACSSPLTTATLPDGAHTFSVFATDAAGHVETAPATRDFTIDTRAPDTTILSGPEGSTTDKEAAFTFAADTTGATFSCRLDDGEWSACVSGVSLAGFGIGPHVFSVRAADDLGNLEPEPATRGWTLEPFPPPVTTILDGPEGPTFDRSAAFRFEADQGRVTFACRLDGKPFSACESGITFRDLAFRSHAFRIRATNADGVAERTEVIRRWTVVRRPLPRRTKIVARWDRFKDPPYELLFTSLRVRHVPAGTAIRVRCGGASCPPGARRTIQVDRFATAKSLKGSLTRTRLLPGVAIDVTVTKRGFAGIGKRYCVRRGHPPRIREYAIGAKRPSCG